MKKILLTLSLTALLLFTAGCSCPFSDKTADSKPQMNTAAASAAEAAPDFSYKELGSGKTMRLSDLKGKPVFINFCNPWSNLFCLFSSQKFIKLVCRRPFYDRNQL